MAGLEAAAAVEAAKAAAPAARTLAGWVRERLRWKRGAAPSLAESVDEAGQQRLAKDAKIQTGLEAVFLQNLHLAGQEEIDDVRKFKERHGLKDGKAGGAVKIGGHPSPGGNHSDLIMADRMEFNYPRQSSGLITGLLGAGLGAVAIWLATHWPGSGPAVPPVAVPPVAPTQAIPPQQAPAPPEAPAVSIKPPDVSVDDLRLRVRWRMEGGKLKTEVVEEPAK